jgi:hypothetical protein
MSAIWSKSVGKEEDFTLQAETASRPYLAFVLQLRD